VHAAHPTVPSPRSTADTRTGFDRRLFIDLIALLALVGTPTLLVLAALADRPYILVGLALVIPALAAVPVALERRHGLAARRRAGGAG
jgi:uncharacterized membrane protein YhfC